MQASLPDRVMRFAVPAASALPSVSVLLGAVPAGTPRPSPANDNGAPDVRARVAGEPPIVLARTEGLDLLEWLGLGRPEFGAMRGDELASLCRRRLWPLPRNLDAARGDRPRGTLRARTAQLLGLAEQAGERPVMFG
jgi:hypothetical protein